jgi:hypothetical protein
MYIHTWRDYGRKNWQVWSYFVTTWCGLVRPRSVDSLFYTISIAMQQWADKIVGLLMKPNTGKVILFFAARLFRKHLNISRRGSVPGHHRLASAGTDGKRRHIYVQPIDSLVVSLQNSENRTFMKMLHSLIKTPRQNLYTVTSKVSWNSAVWFIGIHWFNLEKFLHEGTFSQTENEMHKRIFNYLRDPVRRKHSEKWRNNSWCLLHDNAPAHRSVLSMIS